MSQLDNVRVEVAFSSSPDDPLPTFTDLTSRVRMTSGISIARGRSEASGEVQTGSCSLVFDNTDGHLTPENAGSPYYPNVKPQNRLRVTYDNGVDPVAHRFDGYVDEWPIEWPAGGQTECVSQVRAFDLLARLSRARQLGSVIAETIRLDDPLFHFPLDEPRESVSAGDRVAAASMSVEQYGAGGTVEFAAGTGPATDGASSPIFECVDRFNGVYLVGTVPLAPSSLGRTLSAVALSSLFQVQTIAEWVDVYGVGFRIGFDAAGLAEGVWKNPWDVSQFRVVKSAGVVADGRTHLISATVSDNAAGTSTIRLFVDGVEVDSDTFPTPSSGYTFPILTQLSVGGTPYGDMFSGTVSHVMGFGTALSFAELGEHAEAVSTGFAGETSTDRILRIIEWGALGSVVIDADYSATAIGHVDCAGKTPIGYLQEIADTEAGILFVDGEGVIRLFGRSRTYDVDAAVDVTVTAEEIGPDARMASGIADVTNDVTVAREGGATVRVFDAASIADYGVAAESISTLADSDVDSTERANWEIATRRAPSVRLPQITLDGLTEPGSADDVRRLGIWDRVAVTGMPSQAPRATEDLRVQGYTEDIGTRGWTLTANTSPFLVLEPLITDDATNGRVDNIYVAVY